MVESKAQVMGHPIHPMLIVFPTGLFPLALVFDLVWVYTRDVFWLSAAFWTLAAGLAATLLAALVGLVDYLSVVPSAGPARRAANYHLATGLALGILVAGSLFLRWRGGAYTLGLQDKVVLEGPIFAAIGLLLVAVLLLVAQGWWGAELVYRHRIGVASVPPGAAEPRGLPKGERGPRPGGGEP